MKVKGLIHAKYCEIEKKFDFSLFGCDMSECGYLVVEEVEIDFTPPPDGVLTGKTVELWRAKQREVQAVADRQVADLDRRINEMLCLEYKPESVVA